jgi:hypothetical protein
MCGWDLSPPDVIGWDGQFGIPAIIAAQACLGGVFVFLCFSWLHRGTNISLFLPIAIWGLIPGGLNISTLTDPDHLSRSMLICAGLSVCVLALVLASDSMRRRTHRKAQQTVRGDGKPAPQP